MGVVRRGAAVEAVILVFIFTDGRKRQRGRRTLCGLAVRLPCDQVARVGCQQVRQTRERIFLDLLLDLRPLEAKLLDSVTKAHWRRTRGSRCTRFVGPRRRRVCPVVRFPHLPWRRRRGRRRGSLRCCVCGSIFYGPCCPRRAVLPSCRRCSLEHRLRSSAFRAGTPGWRLHDRAMPLAAVDVHGRLSSI